MQVMREADETIKKGEKKRLNSVRGKGKAQKEQLQDHNGKSAIYPVKGLHYTFLALMPKSLAIEEASFLLLYYS